ncbi:HD domain-containing protein [Solimonas soli]|uniref:HD domain-containing protein n=1 Tax=Solimonas soli TaxID=413479 RepID=UPI0004830ADC|nr:HD domain-containing protein [Solimonas soli]
MTRHVDPLLDELLAPWRELIGADFDGYRHHCQRMLTFCQALHDCSELDRQKLAIAACFHDIGLWTANTLDYLPPSIAAALACLRQRGDEQWREEIALMIGEHHKLRPVRDARYPLVEVFRRADLVDFSLGLRRCGLDARLIKDVRAELPNAGFHRMLLRRAGAWLIRHPLRPAPMMKW